MDSKSSKNVLARDVMTKKVVAISPKAPIFDAAKLMSEHHFDGIPVIEEDGRLTGIITEYDLIIRTSAVNASFLQKILNEVYAKKHERDNDLSEAFKDGAEKMSSLLVGDIMNKDPLSLKEDANFDEIIAAFIEHHKVNPIPIINADHKLVGIISRFDVLRPLNLLGYGIQKNNQD